MRDVLEIDRITKDFGGVRAITQCSFRVQTGAVVALIGPNGAGKTTLFNIISGFYAPDKGRILLNGEDIGGRAVHQIARLGLGRTFQMARMFKRLTVMENMLLARRHRGENIAFALVRPRSVRRERLTDERVLSALLDKVGLGGKHTQYAGELSYGQQKLLEIARVLATGATLLLLDEPAAGVNPAVRRQLREVILDLRDKGTTILFIEHDMPFVMDIADTVVVMDHGREIAVGTPHEIRRDRRVINAYLGKRV